MIYGRKCFMIKKYKFVVIALVSLLIIGLLRYSYKSSQGSSPSCDIKDFIDDKGSDYNYLEDDNYRKYIYSLVKKITQDEYFNPKHFVIDDLNDDGIPEIVIFRQRDPDDKSDPGYLEVYGYEYDKYKLYDRLPMNFDNTNYQLETGYIAEGQKGILLNNQVGAHSGMTYGFVLESRNLKSILNDKKLNLISTYTDNLIRDINDDGILNFSIYTIDPESDEADLVDSDKILLWYAWDGDDSAELVDIVKDRDIQMTRLKNSQMLEYMETLILEDPLSFDEVFQDNLDFLNKDESTYLLAIHIENLQEMLDSKSDYINEIVKENSLDHLFKDLSNFNNRDYISNLDTLKDWPALRKSLFSNLKLGYKLKQDQAEDLAYELDYQSFREDYRDHILQEYGDYLAIMSSNPVFKEDNQDQYMACLTNRMLEIETFKSIYPYSNLLEELDDLYDESLNTYIFGLESNRHFNRDKKIEDHVFNKFVATSKKYSSSLLGNKLTAFVSYLRDNDNIVDESLIGKIKGFEY